METRYYFIGWHVKYYPARNGGLRKYDVNNCVFSARKAVSMNDLHKVVRIMESLGEGDLSTVTCFSEISEDNARGLSVMDTIIDIHYFIEARSNDQF